MKKKAVVLGAGFAGLSSAAMLAKNGFDVTLLEKHNQTGGRAREFEAEGFKFDMGPSWYWMPDVFEKFYNLFGYKTSDFYELQRLSPSYRVFFEKGDFTDLPSERQELIRLFEKREKGAGDKLDKFLKEAAYKYDVGINKLVYKPSKSLLEFTDPRFLLGLVRMDVFKSLRSQVRSLFNNPQLISILEFPVLFLGAMPDKIPALYSLMNYADMGLGTWYPMGGMNQIVKAMTRIAEEQGVKIELENPVEGFTYAAGSVKSVLTKKGEVNADVFVAGADYHHVEQQLLEEPYRNYNQKYWDSRTMAPSSLLFYLGVDKKLKNLLHHNLFFDSDFEQHAEEIYKDPKWPQNPLFYVCMPSVTDLATAPEGKENVFILIPTAPGLGGDDEQTREKYYNLVMERLEKLTGQKIRDSVVYKRSYAESNFVEDYSAFKGNAYGLANTLMQTAILKPSLANKKLKNLFYTGQLTVPGPGVPPSIISGQVVANEVNKLFK